MDVQYLTSQSSYRISRLQVAAPLSLYPVQPLFQLVSARMIAQQSDYACVLLPPKGALDGVEKLGKVQCLSEVYFISKAYCYEQPEFLISPEKPLYYDSFFSVELSLSSLSIAHLL
jgi:hypothetical protein